MKKITILVLITSICLGFYAFLRKQNKEISLLFYNVENLFDTENEPNKNDVEFTPEGKKNWTTFRLNDKINQLAKVIAASSVNAPDFLGLCEVENEQVVQQLCNHPLLKKYQYEVIHENSDDLRGIDVAFCFKTKALLLTKFFALKIPTKGRPTRDILFVEAYVPTVKDSIRFIVNHWPSRYGGAKKSEPNRILAATFLVKVLDSLNNIRPNYTNIVMGDFNDTPQDISLQLLSENNLSYLHPPIVNGIKTISYKNRWYLYDGFLMSNKRHQLLLKDSLIQSEIIQFPWMLTEGKNGILRPKRSYLANHYQGGYSDHLPVLLKWKKK